MESNGSAAAPVSGTAIDGAWETRFGDVAWLRDFALTYCRVD